MKKAILTAILSIITIFMLASLAGAQHTKTMTFSSEDGEITLLPGINAIIRDKDGQLTVEMVPPKDGLAKEYKEVDLKVGDIIFMCNGKSVKSIDDLNKAMEAVEVGGDLGFGIKRDKDRLIATMVKADPQAGGKMMVMTQTIGGEAGPEDEIAISQDGQMLNDVTILDCGILIHDQDEAVKVIALLPIFKALSGEKPEDGDILISINGTSAKTAKEFSSIFDKLKVGDSAKLVFKRGDKTIETTVAKEEKTEGNVIIQKG